MVSSEAGSGSLKNFVEKRSDLRESTPAECYSLDSLGCGERGMWNCAACDPRTQSGAVGQSWDGQNPLLEPDVSINTTARLHRWKFVYPSATHD